MKIVEGLFKAKVKVYLDNVLRKPEDPPFSYKGPENPHLEPIAVKKPEKKKNEE